MRNSDVARIRDMWPHQDVYILGGGTSLAGFNLKKLEGKNVIAINHTIEHFPAPVLFFGDKVFLNATTFDLRSYKGLICCAEKCQGTPPIQDMREQPNVIIFKERRDEPILNPRVGLYHPTSSGMMALNLALQMRAKMIYLLGFDYYWNNGRAHWHDEKPHHLRYPEDRLKQKLCRFARFGPWASRVVNCNKNSLVTEFRKVTLESVFG